MKTKTKKDPAAVSLGSRGGIARANNMSAAERSEASRVASNLRWNRIRAKAKLAESKSKAGRA